MGGYTAQEVARMLGLTAGRLRAYIRAGVLSPERGARGEMRFSFQDLALLRTAEGLVRERIPPARVRRALKKLRAHLSDARPLTGVQLAAEGATVVVRDGGARWQAESGQVLLDFEAGRGGDAAPLTELPARRPEEGEARAAVGGDSVAELSVNELYEIGCDLEETDPEHAEASYRQVLARDPGHPDANVNLGRLVHERGDLAAAEAHYKRALVRRPEDPIATFNLGVALEDQGHVAEALDTYARAVALNPENADAHYNAARLYEKGGDYGAALRHLRAYRNLTRRQR
jgi:tetratricopeptide (TPR) repeat protein